MPSSRRMVAGAGLGSHPWALRTVPLPVATAEALTSSTPSTSSAAAVPTTSMIASCPPTSWKWTCSTGRRCSTDSTEASKPNTASARCATLAGSAASSISAVIAPWVRTTTSSPATTARVQATPPRMPVSNRRSQPGRASRSSSPRTSSTSAPASTSEPRAMSPAMPAKQWNQATAGATGWGSVTARSRAIAQAAPYPLSMPTTVMPDEQAESMDEQRGDALERSAVAGTGGHGDHGRRREPTDDAGQGALHARDDDHRVGHRDGVELGQQPVQAGDAAVGEQGGDEPERAEHSRALRGDGEVRRAGRDDHDGARPPGRRAVDHRREGAALRDRARAETEARGGSRRRLHLRLRGPREEHGAVAPAEQLRDDGRTVLRRLAGSVHRLGHAEAQVAVEVDPCESQVGEGQPAQLPDGVVGRAVSRGDLLDERAKRRGVHDLLYPAQL